ncbi:6674_t:CDS:2 [Ambispora gerdemannii]|uniref:6674_t:CDS:1 n=1 Tax=Ambispora gerdemannii TaxID=144530 RepID=A0A9N9CF64_9GLOM|nr:6674_t:CDS:2 [Ambispora gerdemannii]
MGNRISRHKKSKSSTSQSSLSNTARLPTKRENKSSLSSFNDRPSITRGESEREKLVEVLQTSRVIDGRVFQMANERYLIPCDDQEKNRLQMQHDLMKEIWKGNFSSPIHEKLKKGGIRVLDTGCGTGTWTLDMANKYPVSTFLGVDIIEMFPTNMRPPNAGFLQYNILNGLPFPNETFDFVYQRFLWAAFTQKQWIQLIDDFRRVTKTDGWIELMEFDVEIYNPGPIAKKLSDAVQKHLTSNGINPKIRSRIPKIMANTNNLESIQTLETITPLGNWRQTPQGIKALKDIAATLKSLQVALKAVLGVDNYEYKEMLEQFIIEGSKYRMYIKTFRFLARKQEYFD